MAKKIEAVIFDFGGVILDIDYKATEDAFSSLFPKSILPLYTQKNQRPLFDELETGKIGEEEFFKELGRLALPGVTRDQLVFAWNVILKDTNKERLDFIRKAKNRYRTFLLSNTNAIHKQIFDKTLSAHLDGETFDELFEQAYYSHEIGLRKPHPEVFQYIVRRHGLDYETTLFIDDSIQHIEGARSLGLRTYHLRGDLLDAGELRLLLDL